MSIRAATADFWQARLSQRQPHLLVPPPGSILQNPGKTAVPLVAALSMGKGKISDSKDFCHTSGAQK